MAKFNATAAHIMEKVVDLAYIKASPETPSRSSSEPTSASSTSVCSSASPCPPRMSTCGPQMPAPTYHAHVPVTAEAHLPHHLHLGQQLQQQPCHVVHRTAAGLVDSHGHLLMMAPGCEVKSCSGEVLNAVGAGLEFCQDAARGIYRGQLHNAVEEKGKVTKTSNKKKDVVAEMVESRKSMVGITRRDYDEDAEADQEMEEEFK